MMASPFAALSSKPYVGLLTSKGLSPKPRSKLGYGPARPAFAALHGLVGQNHIGRGIFQFLADLDYCTKVCIETFAG